MHTVDRVFGEKFLTAVDDFYRYGAPSSAARLAGL